MAHRRVIRSAVRSLLTYPVTVRGKNVGRDCGDGPARHVCCSIAMHKTSLLRRPQARRVTFVAASPKAGQVDGTGVFSGFAKQARSSTSSRGLLPERRRRFHDWILSLRWHELSDEAKCCIVKLRCSLEAEYREPLESRERVTKAEAAALRLKPRASGHTKNGD